VAGERERQRPVGLAGGRGDRPGRPGDGPGRAVARCEGGRAAVAAWPLGELQASTEALDLSAFASGAPATSLSGRATATTSGLDRPALIALDLRNARAGRLERGPAAGCNGWPPSCVPGPTIRGRSRCKA
jgi:hypothetical protein